jgi:hypothetical protein
MSERTPRRRTNLAKRRTACLTATTAALRATIHPHGAPVATGKASPAHDAPAASWAQDSQRQLRIEGLSAIEASNVVAYLAGLRAAQGGWSIDEIDRLVALRARVECAGVAS